MIRAAVLLTVVLVFSEAYAEPLDDNSKEAAKTVLEIEYRGTKIRGERLEGIKIIRKILAIDYQDCDWRMVLAEDLLLVGKLDDSRDEFSRIMEIEPDFHEAGVGVARTYALDGDDLKAREYMLRMAKKATG